MQNRASRKGRSAWQTAFLLLPVFAVASCDYNAAALADERAGILVDGVRSARLIVPDSVPRGISIVVEAATFVGPYDGGCISEGNVAVSGSGTSFTIRPLDRFSTGVTSCRQSEPSHVAYVVTSTLSSGTGVSIRIVGRRMPQDEEYVVTRQVTIMH